MQSSGILRWTVLKTVLYRLVGGAVFRYTALDCTDDCFIQVGRGAVFRYTAVDCTDDCFIQVGGGSILHVYCGGLY